MSARKIIIDTDPGQDDAFAILLALGAPELDVVAVTAVAGNAPLSKTERTAPDSGSRTSASRQVARAPW